MILLAVAALAAVAAAAVAPVAVAPVAVACALDSSTSLIRTHANKCSFVKQVSVAHRQR
jgi:hypothetical protein